LVQTRRSYGNVQSATRTGGNLGLASRSYFIQLSVTLSVSMFSGSSGPSVVWHAHFFVFLQRRWTLCGSQSTGVYFLNTVHLLQESAVSSTSAGISYSSLRCFITRELDPGLSLALGAKCLALSPLPQKRDAGKESAPTSTALEEVINPVKHPSYDGLRAELLGLKW